MSLDPPFINRGECWAHKFNPVWVHELCLPIKRENSFVSSYCCLVVPIKKPTNNKVTLEGWSSQSGGWSLCFSSPFQLDEGIRGFSSFGVLGSL